jgi:CDP-glucose 4,6-dehydratase
MAFADAYRNKRVLVTGHTGFKGAWLCEWLLSLGAEVTGLALPPPTNPSLFAQLRLADRLHHHIGDIREPAVIEQVVAHCQPEYLFHLAAQPLVRFSYEQPLQTYQTNVLGTVHILEALRPLSRPCMAVFVTTDKCYENRESSHAYVEDDALGGHDPYSSSKGACEIAIASWRRSFFHAHPVKIASARAGNVIGGGDWALDRIVPDCMRALQRGETIMVRNPAATRPWQHVLEPLSGYLWLAACLADPRRARSGRGLDSAFNFGPLNEAHRPVSELVEASLRHWPGSWHDSHDPLAVHEARLLSLNIDKAKACLGWQPTWNFADTVEHTVAWYRQAASPDFDAAPLVRTQIADYISAAHRLNLPWSQ